MLGKFDSLRDSALHYLCSVDWSNASFGDVEAPSGYVWRISNTKEEVHTLNTEINSVLEDWEEINPEVSMSEEFRETLIGHFLVIENSQGLVTVYSFNTEAELVEHYEALEKEYLLWGSVADEEFPTNEEKED